MYLLKSKHKVLNESLWSGLRISIPSLPQGKGPSRKVEKYFRWSQTALRLYGSFWRFWFFPLDINNSHSRFYSFICQLLVLSFLIFLKSFRHPWWLWDKVKSLQQDRKGSSQSGSCQSFQPWSHLLPSTPAPLNSFQFHKVTVKYLGSSVKSKQTIPQRCGHILSSMEHPLVTVLCPFT